MAPRAELPGRSNINALHCQTILKVGADAKDLFSAVSNLRLSNLSEERLQALTALQNAAFEAIKIIELEKSAIRGGDGHWRWHLLDRMLRELTQLCQEARFVETWRKRQSSKTANSRMGDDSGEWFPLAGGLVPSVCLRIGCDIRSSARSG